MEFLIIGFAFVFCYKIISNISALVRLQHYRTKYEEFSTKRNVDFNECAPAVLKLFKKAGIKDSVIAYVRPAGYGMLEKGNALFFDNLATWNSECAELMIRDMSAAKGIFKGRILEAFSPLYWINCVIFLPRNILGYLGLDADGVVSKVLQLVYWLATPLLIAFRDNIYQYITTLLS